MSDTARRITVIVDADSAPFQEQIAKADDSEKKFIDTVLKAAKDAVAANDATVKSNASVADSYGRTASVVTGSVLEVVDRIMDQMAAQRQLGVEALKTSGTVVEAVERQAEAYGVAKDQMALFADEQAELAGQMQMLAFREEEAYTAVADTATASADKQIESAAKIAEAATASAEKQAESYAAAGDASAAAADKQASSAAKSTESQAKSFGASGTGLVTLGKRVLETAGVVGVGSLYMSERFESMTTRLQTQAGASTAELVKLRAGMLSMAGSLGQTPEHLEEGLYHIVSSMEKVLPAAHRTSEELDIMKVAAEGAAIGGTSMEETSYTLASAMNALHERAADASQTMAELNAIVGSGDMTMSDLLAALKSGLIPTAAQFGISLQSVGAALAVMGDMGMRGAMAGTRLRMSIALIGAPAAKASEELTALGMSGGEVHARTTAMTEALDKAGLSTTTMAADLKKPDGIAVALSDLKRHLTESGVSATDQAAIMVRAFGGGRMASTIDLLTQNVGRVGIKYAQIGHEVSHFGNDWAKTQETLKFELDETGASIEALGIHIGEDLTPEAQEALKGLKEMADWLDHNKVAAEGLAVVVGGVLSVAVAAFTVNKLGEMVKTMKQAGLASSSAWRWMVGSSGSARGAGGAGGAAGLASKEGQISGSRGVMLPGSMTNPIVVAQESGQYAGLGGEAAAEGAVAGSEGDVKAAAAEGKTASGIVPVAEAGVTEDAVGGAGIMAAAKSTIGPLLSNAMKGGMVGLGGVLASEIAKSAIGGKTGKTVGGVGDDAAIGAGIGTVIEPGLGTAIGGAIGASAGVIKALEMHPAGETTQHLTSGRGVHTQDARVKAQVESERKNELAEESRLADSESGGASPQKQAADDKRLKEVEQYYQKQIGEKEGAGEKAFVLGGVKNPGLESIVNSTKDELEKLSTAGREGMIGFVKSMVQTLEQEGRLPHESLAKVFDQLKPLLTDLPHMSAQTGKDFTSSFLNNLNTGEMLSKLVGVTKEIESNWAREYKLLPVTAHMAMSEVITNSNTDLGKLTDLMKHGTAQQMIEAKGEYAKLAPALKGYLDSAKTAVEGELGALGHSTGPLTLRGTSAIIEAYEALPPSLKTQLDNADGQVKKGIKKINSITATELKVLGGAASVTAKVTHALDKVFAQGGLVQLGRPGEAGRDTIPLNAGGIPIMAGPGEQIAVFTRHQQKVANAHMASIGGLPGLFKGVSTPNYMATGGFVAEPGQNFTAGFEPQIVADLRKLGAELKEIVYGISGYRSPSHSVAVGGFSNDPHTEGKAADIGVGVPTLSSMLGVPEADLRKVGLYRPFFPPDAKEANHVQLIGVPFGNNPGIPAGAGSSGIGGAAAVAKMVAQIATPKVSGSGVMSQIAQAALSQVASAANKALGSVAGGAGGEGSTGGGTHSANEALGKRMMLAAGFPAREWGDLQKLWTKESGWSDTAVNASSGAAGIAQSLGHGPVQLGNARSQIAWGLKYIKERYGSPSQAWAHEVANNWYAQGGIVGVADGLVADAATTHKSKVNKGAKTPPKNHGKGPKAPSLGALVSKIGKIPDTENVRRLQAFQPILTGLENERALLSKIQSEPDHQFIVQADMAELGPTLAPGESITPGMTTTEALRQHQIALTRNGESPELSLQQELLGYYAELPSHHLLTPADVGVLQGAGVKDPSVKAWSSIYGPIENAMAWQINKTTDLAQHEEQEAFMWKNLVAKYETRQVQVEDHAKAEYKRYSNIKAQIQRLTTGTLKERVKNAEDATYRNELKADAQTSETVIAENISGEKQLPAKDQNKKLIAEWQAEKLRISAYEKTLSKPLSGTEAAKVALQKDSLTNELHPIEENLKELAGSSTSIGHMGDYGKLATYIKTLNEGITKIAGEAGVLSSSTIPGLVIELSTQRAEDIDAGLKPAPTILSGSETTQETALNTLLKEKLQQMGERAAVEGADLFTLQNFIPQIPHYEKGGPVLDDGLIYAHRGEHVVPQGGTLVSNSAPPVVHVHHETHVHGDATALIKVIDSRVTHPENIRKVSQQISRRGNLIKR